MRLPEDLTSDEEKAVAYGLAHLKVIAFIEGHLSEPLSLERIADAAGYSPWQFSRRFRAMQGESVMAYVRGQRLQHAALRMARDSRLRVLDVAIDSGFESQAAFTRAFTRAFGAPPGRVRQERASRGRQRRSTVHPRFERRTVELPDLELMGMRRRFTPANYEEFAPLWESVIRVRRPFGGTRRDESFGLLFESDPSGAFTYVAATRAWTSGLIPGVERVSVRGGRYFAMRHLLDPGPLLPQTNAAEDVVSRAREASGASWTLQRYPENFGGSAWWIDHFIPVDDAQPPLIR